MKINRLETHDRLLHFVKQDFDIQKYCQDIINSRPFGDHPFYIFAHTRSLGWDEKMALIKSGQFLSIKDVPEKRLIWQPRLTRPEPQSNSMLFKAYPGTDNIKICWMIPARELWDQYKDGNVTEHDISAWSIWQFQNNKKELEKKEPDDLDDKQIDAIYREISRGAKYQRI